MKNKEKIIILITGVVCGIIIAGLFVFIFSASKNEGVKQEQGTTQAASKNKKEIANLKLQLQGAEDALQNAKTGKNNQNVAALETLAQSLFKVYYTVSYTHLTLPTIA